jgi:hypothetical protein
VVDPRTGGVTAVQRSGSAIPHLDAGRDLRTRRGRPRSLRVPTAPEDEDVEAILCRVLGQTAKVLAAYEEESEDEALAALQAAEVDRRIRYPDPFPRARRSAFLEGFSLHAGVRIHDGLNRVRVMRPRGAPR